MERKREGCFGSGQGKTRVAKRVRARWLGTKPDCRCQPDENTLAEQKLYKMSINAVQIMRNYSDYIVYVDESGDHSLVSIDRNFPVFALSFCIFAKADYTDCVVPATQRFKFRCWGHDAIVLHEREVRKSIGNFTFPRVERQQREQFIPDLADLIDSVPFRVIGAVIRKENLVGEDVIPRNPYAIAMRYCMEELHSFLLERDQQGKLVYIVLEHRGEKENQDLEREFRIFMNDIGQMDFELRFAKKAARAFFTKFDPLRIPSWRGRSSILGA